MKKLLILSLLVASAGATHAQSIPAGTISLGGNVGYSRSSSKTSSGSGSNSFTTETTNSQFSIEPSVGYFVKDNLAIGLSLGYSAVRNNSTYYSAVPGGYNQPELDPTTRFRIGAFAQYYHMLTEQFGFTGLLGAGYQSTHIYNYNDFGTGRPVAVDYKGSGYYASLTPGIVFFPIPKLGLGASIGSLGYSHMSYDYPTGRGFTAPMGYESTTSDFGASFGLSQLLLSGTYYFGR